MDDLSLNLDLDLGADLGLPGMRQRRRARTLKPGEERSLMREIGDTALSGLSAVGNVLDVPGSVVRDIMAGENPFDQLLPWNWTSDQGRISGRDLLRKYGLAGREDTYGNWWGGFATEVLTDPLTYLTLGSTAALSSAGKVAKSVGILDDLARVTGKGVGTNVGRRTHTLNDLLAASGPEARAAAQEAAAKMGANLADIANQNLADGIARVGIPFTDIGVNLGGGKAGMLAAQAMDALGEAAARNPVVRGARALFDPRVEGEYEYARQLVAMERHRFRNIASRAAKLAHAKALNAMVDTAEIFDSEFGSLVVPGSQGKRLGADAAKVFDTYQKLIRYTAELGGDVDLAVRNMFGPGTQPPSPTLAAHIQSIGRDMQQQMKSIRDALEAKGVKIGEVQEIMGEPGVEPYKYWPRYVDEKLWKEAQRLRSRELPTSFASAQKRNELLRNFPEKEINDLLTDPNARGPNAAQYIESMYGGRLDDTRKGGKAAHAKEIAEWVENHAEAELFTMQASDEYLRYMQGAHLVDKSTDAVHEIIRRNLEPAGAGVPLEKAYKNANMNADKAIAHLASISGIPEETLRNSAIPLDIANAIVAAKKPTDDAVWGKLITSTLDSFTEMFKRSVTVPFPSFWTRNLTSGQYVNLVSGIIQNAADAFQYARKFSEAFHMLRSGLSRDVMQELTIEGVIDPRTLSEGVESLGWGFTATGPGNPLDVRKTLGEAIAGVSQKQSIIDRVPGGQAVRIGWETVLRTGEKVSAQVEFLNRVAPYLYLREKGWSKQAAAAKVRELQIDYSELAPFEKTVMKRLMPFYSFQRRMAPVIIETLVSRPGGAMAQTVRLTQDASQPDVMTPEHVSETLAIPHPFKSLEDGTRSYLTGFGLPFEQHFQYLTGVRDAGRELLAQVNPIIRGSIEWSSNQSFFQRGPQGAGRPLDDLDPTIGRTISNLLGADEPVRTPRSVEFLIANSPLSRLATTARQLTDPRKSFMDHALNTLTGVRVTDISPAAQQAVLRERADDVMRDLGARQYLKVYFSDEQLAAMSPEQMEQAARLQALQNELARRARARSAGQHSALLPSVQ